MRDCHFMLISNYRSAIMADVNVNGVLVPFNVNQVLLNCSFGIVENSTVPHLALPENYSIHQKLSIYTYSIRRQQQKIDGVFYECDMLNSILIEMRTIKMYSPFLSLFDSIVFNERA